MNASLTTFSCPACGKIYITTIQVRQTISGGRPTLLFPRETCNNERVEQSDEGPVVVCGFDFTTIPVESFDIPIDTQTQSLIQKARR
jgi:hypothetical protein